MKTDLPTPSWLRSPQTGHEGACPILVSDFELLLHGPRLRCGSTDHTGLSPFDDLTDPARARGLLFVSLVSSSTSAYQHAAK